ncbi:MAG TPA: Rossmann-like and DUF2520 domain-containing protein [Puia sp.]|nr:Rossmann-like and DUF2520 domain-containing protein [Puia sp.]
MDIVLIGSGNTATVLGRKSLAAGHRIVQVYSRNANNANQLSIKLGTSSTSYISSIEKRTDLIIIAIKDEAVSGFLKNLGEVKCLIAHTAGAIPMSVAKGSNNKLYGVLYPLQSLRKEMETIPPITMLVDGNSHESKKLIKEFAGSIAEKVLEADDETRLKYHLTATIVNNFTNYLFILAESFCKKENISFEVLQPLMEETVLRMRNNSPGSFQTGPAIRGDKITLEKHRQLLVTYPALSEFYEMFTKEIQNLNEFRPTANS